MDGPRILPYANDTHERRSPLPRADRPSAAGESPLRRRRDLGAVTEAAGPTLGELAERLSADLVGDGETRITGLASLEDAGPSDLSFYADDRYQSLLESTEAGALLVREPLESLDAGQLVHPDPYLAFLGLIDSFFPPPAFEPGVSPRAEVAPSATLGDGVFVGPFARVGERARIGDGTVVHGGVSIGHDAVVGAGCVLGINSVIRESCSLGNRVILHPGAIIGSDGFGFARRDGRFTKVRHVGRVVVEDDVEIGANATIDRGTLGATRIRRGVKLDNLVHVAHNVEIGEHSAMAAQAGVSGSTVIGKRVLMGGQVGIVDHLHIGDDAILIAQAGVIGDIAPKAMVSGYPARPHREVLKAAAGVRGLDALRRRVAELEARLSRLEEDDPDPS